MWWGKSTFVCDFNFSLNFSCQELQGNFTICFGQASRSQSVKPNLNSNQGVTRLIHESNLGRGQHPGAHRLGMAMKRVEYSEIPQTAYYPRNFLVGLDWVSPDHKARVYHLNVFVFNGVSSSIISFAWMLTMWGALSSSALRINEAKSFVLEHDYLTFENLLWLISKRKVRHRR